MNEDFSTPPTLIVLTPLFPKDYANVSCTYSAATAAKSLQSCPTLCDPMDGSPPGSPVPGILQARTLEWVAISFSNAGKWKVKVKSLSHVWLLSDPMDYSLPGSSIPGILQARTLEWVAISFSNAGKWKVKVKSLSRVWLLATPWTVAHQAPPSMGFSRQEYWSGVPLPSPALILGCCNCSVYVVCLQS